MFLNFLKLEQPVTDSPNETTSIQPEPTNENPFLNSSCEHQILIYEDRIAELELKLDSFAADK